MNNAISGIQHVDCNVTVSFARTQRFLSPTISSNSHHGGSGHGDGCIPRAEEVHSKGPWHQYSINRLVGNRRHHFGGWHLYRTRRKRHDDSHGNGIQYGFIARICHCFCHGFAVHAIAFDSFEYNHSVSPFQYTGEIVLCSRAYRWGTGALSLDNSLRLLAERTHSRFDQRSHLWGLLADWNLLV